jgi:hypothetical protein
MTTTITDLVAEYIRKAEDIVVRGGKPAIPGLMQEILATHPEIDLHIFAAMCEVAMREAGKRHQAKADALERELERRRQQR